MGRTAHLRFPVIGCLAFALLVEWGAAVLAQTPSAQDGMKTNILRLAGDDLALAKALDASLAGVTSAVTACTGQGKTLEACQCERVDVVRSLDVAFNETMRLRPAWAADDVILYWEQEGRSINLSPGGIRRAIAIVTQRCGKG